MIGIEVKKKRILDAAHSIGFIVRQISTEGKKTVITFKKAEKFSESVKVTSGTNLKDKV